MWVIHVMKQIGKSRKMQFNVLEILM